MINKRLMNLLQDSKKYVAQMVVWNWLALLCNIIFIFSFAYLLENMFMGKITTKEIVIIALIDLCMISIRYFCHKRVSNSRSKEDFT